MRYSPYHLTLVFFIVFFPVILAAQTGKLTGTLTEEGSNQPLAGVSIKIIRAEDTTKILHGYSNADGKFTIKNIAPGKYAIFFTSLGYKSQSDPAITILSDKTTELNIALSTVPIRGEAIVVTASRRPEKITDAPATITYVSAKEIEEHPGFSPIDQLTGVPGVYVVQTGIGNSTFATRGQPAVFDISTLTMQDYRITSLPSLRVNSNYLMSTVDDDIDHIEVVRGPGSALYGPDVTEGIIHIITKSPFSSQGTTLSLTGGEHNLFYGTIRHAGTIGENLGYKISGSYFRATEWDFNDTIETSSRATAIKNGANPDTLRIGKRYPQFDRYTIDGRLDWTIADNATAVFSAGTAEALHGLESTTIGTTEILNWHYNYYQARLTYDDLFLQGYLNQSNSSNTYNLRTGMQVIDHSTQFVLQAQHTYLLFPQERLVYGADYYHTNPMTDGTIDGINEENDQISILGAYLQSETNLFDNEFSIVAAGRIDKHNRISNPVFSPRLGLVWKPSEQHVFHLTYNKAYQTPTTQDLFFDFLYQAQPFKIRLEGLPINGLTFTPGIMHSDFSGDPTQGIAVDQAANAKIWANYMKIISQLVGNPALAGIPAPPTGAMRSSVGLLNAATGNFDPASDTVANIGGPVPRYVQTIEFSYEFKPNTVFDMVADVYHKTWNGGLINRFVTPSVLYNSKDMVNYLTQVFKASGMPDSTAAMNANLINSAAIQHIPVGTISPNESPDPTAILNTSVPDQNSLYVSIGADLYFSYEFNRQFSVSGTYSYLSKPVTSHVDPFQNFYPYHRTNLALKFRDPGNGIMAEIRHRWIDTYFSNDVPGFFSSVPSSHFIDLTFGYTIPSYTKLQFVLSVSNLLDNKYQAIAGTPPIGRLATIRAHYTL